MSRIKLDRRRLLAAAGSMSLFAGFAGWRPAWGAPTFNADPFSLGVAAGDPWPDGFVIWTRLAPSPLDEHGGMPQLDVPVRWEVASDERFSTIVQSGEAVARPELAHSVHVEVGGLQPSRPYWYRFHVEGADASRTGMARTAPAAGALPPRVRLALAGCQSYPSGWYDAWRHISNEPDLDAVFHYGDYIYESGHTGRGGITDIAGKPVERDHIGDEIYTIGDYRRRYGLYKLDPDLQAAHAAAAFITSFDDHEVDNDWASAWDQDGTPPEIFALRKYAAMQAWYEHQPVRKSQFPRPDIIAYRRLDYGKLFRMHVLDTRSYRTNQICDPVHPTACRTGNTPDETMLGPDQEAWLSKSLDNDARWNLIAQQVWVMPLDLVGRDGNGVIRSMDKWDGCPAARKRLVKSITDRGLKNVVIASGDAHLHLAGTVPARDDERDGPAVATEFLGTSISSNGDGGPRTAFARRFLDVENPNLALAHDQRGYQTFDITPDEWLTHIKVLEHVHAPGAPLSTLARFTVLPDQPGLHRA
ncbi:MAG: alkaline phosphatase D family protein [Hyphomonadaceae bacterium]